jgi:hypothetical protein
LNLKPEIEDILFSGEDYYRITRGINCLYEKFSGATQIFAGDLTDEYMKQTQHGKVVTPIHAAHCLKDIARTTHFLRGIHKAIEYYFRTNSCVLILYAGCGPYATLLTPFTALYRSDQLQFTFLEIEEISFRAINKLYDDWGLRPYLEEARLTDATDPEIQFNGFFDIILSETMQVGLKNECQVPITRNLVRFLKHGGTFIPQQIKLDVFLTGKKRDPLIPDSDEKLPVGTAYNFDFRHLPEPAAESILKIPTNDMQYLKLYTTIHLFEDEKLTAYQSGLTLPLILDRSVTKTERSVRFWYKEGTKPQLEFEYLA